MSDISLIAVDLSTEELIYILDAYGHADAVEAFVLRIEGMAPVMTALWRSMSRCSIGARFPCGVAFQPVRRHALLWP